MTGLVSVIGIEWATARLVAERVVDVLAKRHEGAGPCKTRTQSLPDYATTPSQVACLDTAGIKAFVETHIAQTQARHLDDIVLRRTNDLVLGHMTHHQLRKIADVMTDHFGWSDDVRNAEIRSTLARLAPSRYRQALAAAFAGVDL